MQKVLTVLFIIFLFLLAGFSIALSFILFTENKKLQEELKSISNEVKELQNEIDAKETEKTSKLDCENSSQDGEIVITKPCANEKVKGKITVEGKARAFENTILVEVVNDEGDILHKEVITFASSDIGEFGDFSVILDWTPDVEGEVILKAYEQSAKDGSEIHVVEVPFTLE